MDRDAEEQLFDFCARVWRELLERPDFEAMTLTAVLTPAPEGGFVALNPETGTTTQGETVPETLANLREATELYLEEFPLTSAGSSWLTTFEVAGHD